MKNSFVLSSVFLTAAVYIYCRKFRGRISKYRKEKRRDAAPETQLGQQTREDRRMSNDGKPRSHNYCGEQADGMHDRIDDILNLRIRRAQCRPRRSLLSCVTMSLCN